MSFINSHSRLTIDPCIQRAAKDVLRYAQEVARKSDHAASDLLITAVWNCLNCSCGSKSKPWPDSAKKTVNKSSTNKDPVSLVNKVKASISAQDKSTKQTAGKCGTNVTKKTGTASKNSGRPSLDLSGNKEKGFDKSVGADIPSEDDAIVLSDGLDGEESDIEHVGGQSKSDKNTEVSKTKNGTVIERESSVETNYDRNDDLFDMDCEEIDEEEEHQLLYDEKKDKAAKPDKPNKSNEDLSEDDQITIITDDDDNIESEKQTKDNSKKSEQVHSGKDKGKKTETVARSDVISLDTDSDEGEIDKTSEIRVVENKNKSPETNTETVEIKTEPDIEDFKIEQVSPTKSVRGNNEKEHVEAQTAQDDYREMSNDPMDVKVELNADEPVQGSDNVYGCGLYDLNSKNIPSEPTQTETQASPQLNMVYPQPGTSAQQIVTQPAPQLNMVYSQPCTSAQQIVTTIPQSSIIQNLGAIPQAVPQPQVQNNVLVPSMLGLVPFQQAGQSTSAQPNSITETTITYYTQNHGGMAGGQKIQVIERQALVTNTDESPPSKMRLLDFDKKWHTAPKMDLQQERVTERDFLPKPECPAENAANIEVLKELQSMPRAGVKRKRGSYGSYTPELRCKIAKYAMEHSNIKTAKHFSIELKREINESTIRFIKAAYLKKSRTEGDFASTSNVLPKSPRGRPLKIGKHEAFVKDYINKLIASGGFVNNRIIISAAKGYIQSEDKSLLAENGGKLKLTKDWASSLMKRMGLTKGKGTKGEDHHLENFVGVQNSFLERISEKVEAHNIPDDLIINWDQTGCNFVPDSSWGMAEDGSKQVQIAHADDKRHMTVVLACTKSGSLLSPQLLYQGKSVQCHADYEFPEDWDIHHTETHGSTSESMERFLNKIILPYIDQVKANLNLPTDQHSLCVFNLQNIHPGEEWRELLQKHNIHPVYVPANCTDKLQPLDLSIYSIIKQNMKQCFEKWYADQISNQLQSGSNTSDVSVDLRMSIIKPLHAMWLTQTLQDLAQQQSIIQYGWVQAGFVIPDVPM